jgi:hypothetical protein
MSNFNTSRKNKSHVSLMTLKCFRDLKIGSQIPINYQLMYCDILKTNNAHSIYSGDFSDKKLE